MEEFQTRVVEEQKELESIKNGYRDSIPQDERDRLFRQGIHMREYNDVLKERIADFVIPQES